MCTAADELVALAGGTEDNERAERSLRLAQQRLGENATDSSNSIAEALSRLARSRGAS